MIDWDILRFLAALCMDLCSENKGCKAALYSRGNGGMGACAGIISESKFFTPFLPSYRCRPRPGLSVVH